MKPNYGLIIILSVLNNLKSELIVDSEFYTAGVVEFTVNNNHDSEKVVSENLREYLKIIDGVRESHLDVLVFPEGTLNYHGLSTRKKLLEDAVEIPDPNQNGDGVATIISNVVSQLSQKAKEANCYILVNLVEKEYCADNNEKCSSDGHNLYNTNVVFDRAGNIVSRYRKYNLFLEPFMNVTEEAQIETFASDFGVTFGHFVCFDILFKSPAERMVLNGVKHVLYANMWFSELPFLTAAQVQFDWAYTNNVALISAGANNPAVGSTGSGIYIGKHGSSKYMMSPNNMTKVLISKVPKVLQEYHEQETLNIVHPSPKVMQGLKLTEFDLRYTTGLTKQTKRVCEGKVCCEFELKYTKLDVPVGKKAYSYRLTVFSGVRHYARIVNAGELHCAVIACTEDKHEHCGKRFDNYSNVVNSVLFESIAIRSTIEIEGSEENYMIMPTTLDTSILPLNVTSFTFQRSSAFAVENKFFKNMTITSVGEISNFLTFGIYGRNFNLDSIYTNESISTFNLLTLNTFLWSVIVVIFAVSYNCV